MEKAINEEERRTIEGKATNQAVRRLDDGAGNGLDQEFARANFDSQVGGAGGQ
jgi:hypothetical protein